MKKKKKIPAVIETSVKKGRLGLPSKIAEDFAGEPVLRRTVRKLSRVEGTCENVWIIVPKAEEKEVKELLKGLPAIVFPSDEPDIPSRKRLQRGRKWAPGSWRGGIGNSYFAGETGRPRSLSALCDELKCDHLLLVPAEAPLLDPVLVDELLTSFRQEDSRKKLYLATSPPGMSGDLFSKDMLEIMGEAKRSLDGVLDFRMDASDHYVDGLGMFHWYENTITSLRARLCADTEHSLQHTRAVSSRLGNGWEEAHWKTVIDTVRREPLLLAGDFPQEICVELTNCRHHNGPLDGPRRPERNLSTDTFTTLLKETAHREDVRFTLGLGGEPFLHPRITDVLYALAEHKPFGLHIHTDAVEVTGEHLKALEAADPDVVSVALNATTAETYKRIHNSDGFEKAVENTCRIADKLAKPGGFVVPEFTLCDQNAGEVEGFYDMWYRNTGWVTVRDHDDLAGQRKLLLSRTHTPVDRTFCSHLLDKLVVLPTGAVVLCPQDLWGKQPAGEVGDQSIESLWKKRPLESELCSKCRSWAF